MLFAVHNQHVSRTFFGSIILAVSILNSQASFLGLDPQAFQYLDPSTLGFLQAMEDLEQMKAPERIPDAWDLNYESYAIPAEPFGPPVYIEEIEPEEYYEQLYEEEPYGGLKQTEEEMVELLESMSPAEIDDFSDWLVAEGNENYLFTFLQMLDNQLVDKFNEDIEEENEIINVLSNIESLAADVAEKEKAMAVAEMVRPEVDYFPKRTLKREVSPDFYPQAGGFLVYGPEKRMVLAREAMNPEKRWGLW